FLIRLFQAPTRIIIMAQFSLATLAGMGIDIWTKPVGRRLYWLHLLIAAAVAMLFSAFIFWLVNKSFYPTITISVIILSLEAILFGFVLQSKPERNDGGIFHSQKWIRWEWMVGSFFILDLIIFQWGLNPGINSAIYNSIDFSNSPIKIMDKRGIILPEDEYLLKFKDYFRFDAFQPESDWEGLRKSWIPNLNLLDSIAMVNNFDPFVPKEYADWIAAIGNAQKGSNENLLKRLLKLSAVGWIAERAETGKADITPFSGLNRVSFYPCAEMIQNNDEIARRIMDMSQTIEDKLLILSRKSDLNGACKNNPNVPFANIQTIRESPNELIYTITTEHEGWLVLADVYYPGWVAKLNGKPIEIYQANYLFRAVYIPSGYNEVQFSYRPFSFKLGAAISIITILGMFVLYQRKHNAHR
ncbi:MAG: YfhO family protein, partial [Anaerolineales bacterium]